MLEPVITHILLIGNCNHISVAVIAALYDIIDPDLALSCKEVELCQTVVGHRTEKKNILCIVAMDSSCTIYLLALWNTLSLNEHILCFDGEMQSSYESRIWQYETIFYSSLEAGWLCEFEMVLTIYFLSVLSSFIISRSLSVCRS